ncbi:MAG: hypothetical protein ACE5FF_12010 [Saprospiraceae bacterium]
MDLTFNMDLISKNLRTCFLRNLAEPSGQFYAVIVRSPSDWESDTLDKITRRKCQFEIALEVPEGNRAFRDYLRYKVAAKVVAEPFLGAWLKLPGLNLAQAQPWLADYQTWEERRRVQAIFQTGQAAVQGTLF